MENIIQIQSLSFGYSKSNLVLDHVTVNVPKGSIYGFLGPNGAGKSTTMSLLTGILGEKSNSIKLFGESLQKQIPFVFSKIGSLVESPALYPHLTGYDNLKYIARIRKIEEDKIAGLLDLVDLSKHGKKKVRQYSFGMKQRLAIAMALIGDPELLLLDEPVNGLDPNGMVEIRKLLMQLNQEKGVTIFVSSHILSEIEKMCTHVGIINKGKVRFEGTMKELAEKTANTRIQITLNQAKHWMDNIKEQTGYINDNQISVELEKESIPVFIKGLVDQGAELYEVKILDGLEDWFMSITDKN